MKLDPDTIVGYALMSSMYAESHIVEAIYLLIISHFCKISGLYFVADMLFKTNGRISCLGKNEEEEEEKEHVSFSFSNAFVFKRLNSCTKTNITILC